MKLVLTNGTEVTLTVKEAALVNTIHHGTDYSDKGVDSTPWTFAACGDKSSAAVLGSLIRKGVCFQQEYEKGQTFCGFKDEAKDALRAALEPAPVAEESSAPESEPVVEAPVAEPVADPVVEPELTPDAPKGKGGLQGEEKVKAVRDLLNLADNAGENEALAAMATARKLMDKWGVSMADVEALKVDPVAEGKKAYKKGEKTAAGENRKRQHIAFFEQNLAVAVGVLTETRPMISRVRHATSPGEKASILSFIGEALDVAIAAATFEMLLKSVRHLARKACGSGWTPKHRSFAEGFTVSIHKRAVEIEAERSGKAYGKATGNAETFALVRASKGAWLDAVLAEMGIKPAPSRSNSGKLDLDAYFGGKAEGEKADLRVDDKLPE
jgi:hypothetical protein